jgi:hypothetical protein
MNPGETVRRSPDAATSRNTARPEPAVVDGTDLERCFEVLSAEYNTLMAALSAAWSASLNRTSLFLGVVSAAGVAFGISSQGGIDSSTFRAVAFLVLLLTLFLGIATFIRLVEVQREAMVYITGMNRIRHFFAEFAPAARPLFVLPTHDDESALYRSIGTGMHWRRPRFRLLNLTVQTQGIVGVITAVIAGGCGGLAGSAAGPALGWTLAAAGFVLTLCLLFLGWHRSLAELRARLVPMYPTPFDGPGDPVIPRG